MLKEQAIALNRRWMNETQGVITATEETLKGLKNRMKEYEDRIKELNAGDV